MHARNGCLCVDGGSTRTKSPVESFSDAASSELESPPLPLLPHVQQEQTYNSNPFLPRHPAARSKNNAVVEGSPNLLQCRLCIHSLSHQGSPYSSPPPPPPHNTQLIHSKLHESIGQGRHSRTDIEVQANAAMSTSTVMDTDSPAGYVLLHFHPPPVPPLSPLSSLPFIIPSRDSVPLLPRLPTARVRKKLPSLPYNLPPRRISSLMECLGWRNTGHQGSRT